MIDQQVKTADLGYFGNIWVRQNQLERVGESSVGHKHKFDHVSLLTSGTVEVIVEGHPPKQFVSPTFIVIRKEQNHKFTAITDNVNWYCVFAIRDLDGQAVEELFDPERHDPMSSYAVSEDYWDKAAALDAKTTN